MLIADNGCLLHTKKGGCQMIDTARDNMVQRTNEAGKHQRMYKDRIFRMIFSDKKELLSLYNAMNGTHYLNSSPRIILIFLFVIYFMYPACIRDSPVSRTCTGVSWSGSPPPNLLFFTMGYQNSRIGRNTGYRMHTRLRRRIFHWN